MKKMMMMKMMMKKMMMMMMIKTQEALLTNLEDQMPLRVPVKPDVPVYTGMHANSSDDYLGR